jgi:CheY-like chemotaxis protein
MEKEKVEQSNLILVVDDSVEVRALVVSLLNREGFSAVSASNGIEAIERARQENFALIIMDLQMPLMSGSEAIRVLRETGCNTPVLILSADTADKLGPDILNQVEGILVKPFTVSAFSSTILNFFSTLNNPVGNGSLLAKNLLNSRNVKNSCNISLIPYYIMEMGGGYDIFYAFLKEALNRFELMKKALKDQDITTLRSLSHQMKSAGAFGFKNLSTRASDSYQELQESRVITPKAEELFGLLFEEISEIATLEQEVLILKNSTTKDDSSTRPG